VRYGRSLCGPASLKDQGLDTKERYYRSEKKFLLPGTDAIHSIPPKVHFFDDTG
jgi:hypothetical protein